MESNSGGDDEVSPFLKRSRQDDDDDITLDSMGWQIIHDLSIPPNHAQDHPSLVTFQDDIQDTDGDEIVADESNAGVYGAPERYITNDDGSRYNHYTHHSCGNRVRTIHTQAIGKRAKKIYCRMPFERLRDGDIGYCGGCNRKNGNKKPRLLLVFDQGDPNFPQWKEKKKYDDKKRSKERRDRKKAARQQYNTPDVAMVNQTVVAAASQVNINLLVQPGGVAVLDQPLVAFKEQGDPRELDFTPTIPAESVYQPPIEAGSPVLPDRGSLDDKLVPELIPDVFLTNRVHNCVHRRNWLRMLRMEFIGPEFEDVTDGKTNKTMMSIVLEGEETNIRETWKRAHIPFIAIPKDLCLHRALNKAGVRGTDINVLVDSIKSNKYNQRVVGTEDVNSSLWRSHFPDVFAVPKLKPIARKILYLSSTKLHGLVFWPGEENVDLSLCVLGKEGDVDHVIRPKAIFQEDQFNVEDLREISPNETIIMLSTPSCVVVVSTEPLPGEHYFLVLGTRQLRCNWKAYEPETWPKSALLFGYHLEFAAWVNTKSSDPQSGDIFSETTETKSFLDCSHISFADIGANPASWETFDVRVRSKWYECSQQFDNELSGCESIPLLARDVVDFPMGLVPPLRPNERNCNY